jgi:hypothetical protein
MSAWYAAPLEMECSQSGVRIQYACTQQCQKAPIERPLPLLPVKVCTYRGRIPINAISPALTVTAYPASE